MLTHPLLTLKKTAEWLGVDRDAITAFIKSGELPAVNVARSSSAKRPSWRIRFEDLETFELSRRTGSKPSKTESTAVKRPPIQRRQGTKIYV